MKNSRKGIVGSIMVLIGAICLFISCDLKKDIDIDISNEPPKLAVTATLNGVDSTFFISVSKSTPVIGSKPMFDQAQEPVKNLMIRLYENDVKICEIDHATYLSLLDNRPFESGIYIKGIKVTPGSMYKLDVSANNLATVTSKQKALPLPLVRSLAIDTVSLISRARFKPIILDNQSHFGTLYDVSFYPINVEMDAQASSDRYCYIAELVKEIPSTLPGQSTWRMNLPVYVVDQLLVQSNPLYEAYRAYGDEIEDYLFQQFVFSNQLFAGKLFNFRLDLNTDEMYDRQKQGSYPTPNAAKHKLIFSLSCISEETYRYYRAYILQTKSDIDDFFFSEPVLLSTNIENGYGCFSVITGIKQTLWEYAGYDQYY